MDKKHNAAFATLGVNANHTTANREANDYYATPPLATELLLQEEQFCGYVWEPACGEGHIADVLRDNGFIVRMSDIVQRKEFPHDKFKTFEVQDFLKYKCNTDYFYGDIITNPPYKYALEFVQQALNIIAPGLKVAMLLKLQFLEGQKRKQFFREYPPKAVYVFSNRITCAKNGDFQKYNNGAVAYAWFVWQKTYRDDPIIKWIN